MSQSSFDHDAHLMAVAQGDHRAFLSLYHHEAPHLLALGKKMLVRNAEAEDAVRDSFILIWKHADSCDTSETPGRAWIYSIFRHRVMSTLRDPGRMAPAATTWTDSLPAHGENTHTRHDFYDAIRRLDPAQRRPLLMAYYHGYTYRQIAAHLGQSVDQTQRQIRQALHAIHNVSHT